MQELVFQIIIGIILIVIGVSHMKGNVKLLHSYHIKRIKKEDILPFGKKIGAGTIIIGVTIIIAGVVTYIMQTDEIAKWIVTVGFSSGLTIILYNIIKYNKGLF